MVQRKDLPWAYASLASLREACRNDDHQIVLVNDECDRETEQKLRDISGGDVIVVGHNLGVAGGRNRLVQEAITRGAEFVLSVDDDFLLPPDYPDVMVRAYEALAAEGKRPGILTPATLDFNSVKSVLYNPGALALVERGGPVTTPLTEEVRARIKEDDSFGSGSIYHMGIRDWKGTYCFSQPQLDRDILAAYGLETPALTGAEASLKTRKDAVDLVLSGAAPIEIQTAPGGICLYSVELFDQLGGICETFNPFGYEDADFALRAANLGYRHYCVPEALAIHDIAYRLSDRPLKVLISTQGKMAGTIVRRHTKGGEASGAFLAISNRVMRNVEVAQPLSRDKGYALPAVNRLNALAAYLGNALAYSLPEHTSDEVPSSNEVLDYVAGFVRSVFPGAREVKVDRDAGQVTLGTSDDATGFSGSVRSTEGQTEVSIDRFDVQIPKEMTPLLIHALTSSNAFVARVSGNVMLEKAGAFSIENLSVETDGGIDLAGSIKGERPDRREDCVAPLNIEKADLVAIDRGGLKRVLTHMSAIERRALPDIVDNIARHQTAGDALVAWVKGDVDRIRLAASGVIDGAPGALHLPVTVTSADGAKPNPVLKKLVDGETPVVPAPPPRIETTEEQGSNMKDAVKRLFAEDPRTAPFPENYNPSSTAKFLNKVRYLSASRGMPLSPNEQRMLRFQNYAQGKRAFIIGNGPSLNKLDLTKLKDEYTFGVNAIYLNKDKMGFLPTHYIVEDIFVAEDRADEINALTGPTKWIGNYLSYCLSGGPDTCWMNVACDYRNYPDFPHFSQNAARIVWVGGTVSYIAMQLAFYMGFSEVYLVGFDHSYTVPKEAHVEGRAITSTSDDPNHFHPDYFGKGYRWHDPRVDRMETAYRKARRAYDGAGRTIYNATAGGHLEVFERVEYESLFKKADA